MIKESTRYKMDIRQFSIAGFGWLSLSPTSLSFSGKVLPDDMHITVSYGNESKIADVHLTRQLPGGGKLYATICQVRRDDIDLISEFVLSQLIEFFFRHLDLVNPAQLSHDEYVFIKYYDKDERNAALTNTMKTVAQQEIVRKGKGKGRYRLPQDDETLSKIRNILGSEVLSLFRPKVP